MERNSSKNEQDKVLNKFEQSAFNFAVKVAVQTSEPQITKGEAYKLISNKWGDESYRRQQTHDYLYDRIDKVTNQLDQLNHCLDTLVLYLN
jgi:hypothetical protein